MATPKSSFLRLLWSLLVCEHASSTNATCTCQACCEQSGSVSHAGIGAVQVEIFGIMCILKTCVGSAFVFEVQVGVIVCENHCSDCHDSCHTCSAMYDMHAASVAVHNIDNDKRGDRYKNMTLWHGFEHSACRK